MNLLFAILALGVLVAFHEAGHFFVARWSGMRVHEFAIGFGPKLFSFRRGETLYSLRIIFLGGYVRVAGMNPVEEDADDPRGFLKSVWWKRFLMILAGPVANYLVAILCFFTVYAVWGLPDVTPRAGVNKVSSSFAKLGLAPNDKLLSINGKSIKDQLGVSTLKLFESYVSYRTVRDVDIFVLRNGKVLQFKLPKYAKARTMIGFEASESGSLSIGEVQPKTFAARVGFKKGDFILKLDKKSVGSRVGFWRVLSTTQVKSFEILRDGKILNLSTLKIAPTSVPASSPASIPNKSKEKRDVAYWRHQLPVQPFEGVLVSKLKSVSLGAKIGLKDGDLIFKVDKKELLHIPGSGAWNVLQSELSQCTQKATKLSVYRNAKKHHFTLPKQVAGTSCEKLVAFLPGSWLSILKNVKGKTAEKIGLLSNDWIYAIDGEVISSVGLLREKLMSRLYRPVRITYIRNGEKKHVFAPIAKKPDAFLLGIHIKRSHFYQKFGALNAIDLAFWQTWRWNVKVWDGLKKLVQKPKEVKNFTGPLGIIRMGGQAAERGFYFFLSFFAIISIHLALFNLLPIPALDGGRILFLFIQQIARLIGFKEDATVRVETAFHFVGFLLLFTMLILITFKDCRSLVMW